MILRQMVFEYCDFLTFQRNLPFLLSLAKAGWSPMVCNHQRTNERHFVTKLQRTRAVGLDFDGTLVDGVHFCLLREILSEIEKEAEEKEVAEYFSVAGQSDEWITAFVARAAERLCGCLTREHVQKNLERLPIREGVVNLLHYYLDRSGVLIDTLGVKPFVEMWSHRHLDLSSRRQELLEVAGLDLTWNKSGLCNGFFPESIVTDGSKGDWFRRFCARRRIIEKDTLVLGDSPRTDKSLLRSGGVRVLLWPVTGVSETSEADRQQFIPDLWPDLDAVLIGDSLEPLVQILCGA